MKIPSLKREKNSILAVLREGGVIRHCRRWINMELRPILFPEIKGNEGKVGKSGIGIGDPEGC